MNAHKYLLSKKKKKEEEEGQKTRKHFRFTGKRQR
jgi:hypothetical protein